MLAASQKALAVGLTVLAVAPIAIMHAADVPIPPATAPMVQIDPATQAPQPIFELLPNWPMGQPADRLLPNWELGQVASKLLPNHERGSARAVPQKRPIAEAYPELAVQIAPNAAPAANVLLPQGSQELIRRYRALQFRYDDGK